MKRAGIAVADSPASLGSTMLKVLRRASDCQGRQRPAIGWPERGGSVAAALERAIAKTCNATHATSYVVSVRPQRRLHRRALRPLSSTIPDSVDPSWRDFFAELQRRRRAPVLQGPARARAGRRATTATTGRRMADERPCRRRRRSGDGAPVPTGDARRSGSTIRAARHGFHPRADADPRLPRARPSGGQSRSARPEAARPRIPSSIPATYGFTEADLDRPIFIDSVLGLENATLRADRADRARDLLRQDRRRVHAHPGPGAEGLDPGAHRGHPQPDRNSPRRASARSSSG